MSAKQYSEEFTVLLFAAGDPEDPWWDWACTSHQHDLEVCSTKRLCDYCWLESEVECVGADDLFLGGIEAWAGRIVRVSGKLWSQKYESYDGTDYDSGFEPSLIEELGATVVTKP